MIERAIEWIVATGVFIVICIIFAWPFAWLLTWAWNGSMPIVFGLPTIGFWTAWKLMIVTGLLLKSHGSVSK